MHIALIGAGSVGSALGRAFHRLGHTLVLGVRSPKPNYLTLAQELSAEVKPPEDAAREADLVVLAVPGHKAEAAVATLGRLEGKILLDTTNAVGPGLLPPTDLSGRSQAERIATLVPGARVVKAFNTMGAEHMGRGEVAGQRAAMFLCGNDGASREVVASLAAGLGFEPIDLGGLEKARLIEPLALVWITLAMQRGYGRNFLFSLLRP